LLPDRLEKSVKEHKNLNKELGRQNKLENVTFETI
jgi:hypothetical protein